MKKNHFETAANQPPSTPPFWTRPHVGRRVFFQHIASAVGGYFLMPSRPMESIARASVTPISKAKQCIFVFLAGAPSHVDTFDLKEGYWTPSFLAPATYGDGIRFPQGLFPQLAQQLDSVALVRNLTAYAGVHGLMQTWYQIGRNPTSGLAKIAPHIGSVVALELGPQSPDQTLPAFFSLNASGGPGQAYLSPVYAPFYLSPGGGGLPNTQQSGGSAVFDRRYGLLTNIDSQTRSGSDYGPALDQMAQFNLNARQLMYNPKVDQIFTFNQDEKNRYGNTSFGSACLTARNLVRAQMGTRFIQISLGSWDHHVGIYANNAGLMAIGKTFDLGIGQLIADLKADNTLDDTLIIAMGEFGRTVGPLNSSAGRDHLQQQAVMFAGAGIRGPKTIGRTNEAGDTLVDPQWSRNRAMRAEDLEATIYSALGIAWDTVRHDDPLGRGFEYVPQSSQDIYGPLNELWA